VESAILVAVSVCIFLAFYFSLLSFQAVDDTLKRQFVILAAISLLTGIIVSGCLAIYIGMKKVFVEATLSNIQELSKTEQNQYDTSDETS
jgi:hypothetical protein